MPGEPLQVVGQRGGRTIAIGRRLGQALQADQFQSVRHPRIELPRIARFPPEDVQQRVQGVFPPERRLAGEQFVEDRAQAVNVGGGADLGTVAGGLLGGHVAGRAGDHARGRRLGAGHENLGQAEVGHVGLVVAVQEDVRGLQVAMHHALGVQMVDRPGDDAQQPHDRVER